MPPPPLRVSFPASPTSASPRSARISFEVSSLDMVEEIPAAGLPATHVGVAAGPVIRQGGDYYGRTVNLASRVSDRAAGGQVLVSEPVVEMASVRGVTAATRSSGQP